MRRRWVRVPRTCGKKEVILEYGGEGKNVRGEEGEKLQSKGGETAKNTKVDG